jgi:hypothetical protein
LSYPQVEHEPFNVIPLLYFFLKAVHHQFPKLAIAGIVCLWFLTGCGDRQVADRQAVTPSPSAPLSSPTTTSSSLPSQDVSAGLVAEQVVLARNTTSRKLEPVIDGVFQRGESVNLVLLNVKGFQKGPDGKNSFDIDIQVKDPKGKAILSRQRLLGIGGQRDLPDNIARSPYGIFNTTEAYPTGEYKITLKLYDKVSNRSLTVNRTITLQ